jgi:hypothetical protein
MTGCRDLVEKLVECAGTSVVVQADDCFEDQMAGRIDDGQTQRQGAPAGGARPSD